VAAMGAAARDAREHLEERLHPALDAVCEALLGRPELGKGDQGEARAELITRFGQTTGPVLAKGVEDTAFYRWSGLVALRGVGSPAEKYGTSPEEFPATAVGLSRRWPA